MKFEILEAKSGRYSYNGKVVQNCIITLSPDNYKSDGRLTEKAFNYFCKQGEGTFAREFKCRPFYFNNGVLSVRDENGRICAWLNSYIMSELRRKSAPKKEAPKKSEPINTQKFIEDMVKQAVAQALNTEKHEYSYDDLLNLCKSNGLI